MESSQTYKANALTLEQVKALEGIVILEFGAPWCGHCMAARPAIQEVLAEHVECSHLMIYDGKGKRLGRTFKVKLWPTLILLKAGQEVARLVRPQHAAEVRELMNSI